MSTVTSLKPQRDNKRVNVYLDGKFAFGIDLDNLVKFGIKVNKEFAQSEIDKIISEADFAKTYNFLLNFATLRPRSEKEIKDWLARKKVSEALHKKLFDRLKRLELLDDTKFANWWIGQRLHFKLKSKKELAFELYQKGIDKKIITETLANIEIDELASVKKLVEKNMYKWARYEGRQRKEKITRYLLSKGFSFDDIKDVVK